MWEDEGETKPRLWVVLAFAVLMTTGVLLVVLAAALFKGWWLILTAAIFLLFPLPHVLKGRFGSDGFTDGPATINEDMSLFWTGLLGTSGLALPAVLLHSGIIQSEGFWLGLSGGIIIAAAGCGYIYVFHRRSSSEF